MTKIKIKDIIPFKNHPFKIEEDDSLKELMESINTTGLINPVIVRQKNDKYEMISGHRRLKAYELLGKEEIEANIKELTDDEATILMVDSNMQREKILPSEKAFAYKMRLDAIKHQGKLTSATEEQKLVSRDKIAKVSPDSSSSIQRYIRLTYLIPELLRLVDDTVKYGKNQIITMGIKPAVEISYLSKEEQNLLYAEILYEELTPSHAQAIKIRELSKNKQLNGDSLEEILDEKKGNQNDNKRLEKLLKNEKIKSKNREFINDRIKYNNVSIENYSVIKNNLNNNAMSHYAETNRLISSLATMVMQEKHEQKDPFWNESAKNLLEGIIGFFLEEYKLGNIKREKITMTSIRKFQNSSMEQNNFKKFKEYINLKPYGSKSKDALVSILSASENTYKSITAVFGQKMNLFDDINVANVTSTSDFKFSDLGKEPTALYVIVPDEDKTYFTLVTIIVGLLYRELVKLANSNIKKKLPYEIDFILDEFANCPPLADIEAIVSVARSRGMHFHFFIQSFSQLDNVYGKEVAQIILDNCGLTYLKTNTQETAEAISKRLGKKTIESNSVRQSMSLMNYNGDRSTNLIGRDLMTPEEVKQLHYKTIIFPIIGFPIFRDTILYNKFSCYEPGMIERKVNPLKDLSYTYYVVEDIKYEVKDKRRTSTGGANEIYEAMELADKENLKPIEEIIEKIFKEDYDLKYNRTTNHRCYMSITINGRINQVDKLLIKSKIKEDQYHVEIIEKKEKTIINIHNEGLNLGLNQR